MREILHRAGDIVFTKLDGSNVEAFKQFYTARLKDENQSLYLDYETLEKTIDDDLSNGSVTFMAYKDDRIIGSLKCLDNPADTLKRSGMWNVDLSRLRQYGGLCYMGRYGIDKSYITEPAVNQGLFLLAIMHSVQNDNFFLMTEAVPKQVRTYRRLGFHPVLSGEKPYVWLEVAELCPMINNIIHFAASINDDDRGMRVHELFSDEIRNKIATLSTNKELMNLHHDSLVEYIHEDVAILP
ncbi:N-acyl amino acid synthase FeeM domain-containing protein [Vibrio mangrovi]|uniref:N-acyl amino acid synthase FeeM catalytic core domain-containing protein n=1 Tax=Vibrio mangrovi TaxID=474394 RepID=A0A1Y6IXK7_9VIBR|nr:hypothetical protein [Vibrio mangrovi]MDW6002910.1 hypothetical protein [Vibrio mangrovi]SMS02399.1 hypothetical protein VIM7927_03721 [Vibrio mangrovi]